MKKAGGEAWAKRQLDYNRRVRLADNPDLRLPGAATASIDSAKFTRYYFGGNNESGLSKGLAFKSHLGYNIDNWQDFRAEILAKSRLNPAAFDRETKHGKYYNQKMVVYGPKNNPMDVKVVWEVKEGLGTRFVTAFPD